jgi:hypothetical protein
MKLRILFLFSLLANVVSAQEIIPNDYFIKHTDSSSQIQNVFNPRVEAYFGTSFSSGGLVGNCMGISLMQYNNTLKGDLSIGISKESFNNNMSFNSINLGYSKTFKITDDFSFSSGIMLNYSTGNGQYPLYNNSTQPLPSRGFIH